MAGQARTLKAALEHRTGVKVPLDSRILCWLVEFAAYLMDRCDIGSDGKTPIHRLHGQRDNTHVLEFGERILYMLAKPGRGGKWDLRFHPGVFVGMLNSSSEAIGCGWKNSKFEQFRGLQMAVTTHSTFNSERSGPRRWCVVYRAKC